MRLYVTVFKSIHALQTLARFLHSILIFWSPAFVGFISWNHNFWMKSWKCVYIFYWFSNILNRVCVPQLELWSKKTKDEMPDKPSGSAYNYPCQSKYTCQVLRGECSDLFNRQTVGFLYSVHQVRRIQKRCFYYKSLSMVLESRVCFFFSFNALTWFLSSGFGIKGFSPFSPLINQSFSFCTFPAGRWRAASSNQLSPCLSRTMFSRVLVPTACFHGFAAAAAAAAAWSLRLKHWTARLHRPMRIHFLSDAFLWEPRAATHPRGFAERGSQPASFSFNSTASHILLRNTLTPLMKICFWGCCSLQDWSQLKTTTWTLY